MRVVFFKFSAWRNPYKIYFLSERDGETGQELSSAKENIFLIELNRTMFTMDTFRRWLQRKLLISTTSGDHKSTFFALRWVAMRQWRQNKLKSNASESN